jgi:Spy/CpxP family protein refolding chaperone
MTMRKQWMLVLALAALMYAVPASIAQDANEPPPSGAMGEHGPHGRMDPAKRTEMLTKHLKLNSDQQAKVLDILKSAQSQMEGLRSDTSSSQDDRRAKMMEIHKTTDEQIRGVLDSGQQKKFDEMQARREQWGRGHHQGPPAGQQPDADQPKQ